MPTIDPIESPSDYDVVVIGGMVTPGIARVGDPTASFKWDVKSGPGTDGGTTTYQGIPPRQFAVELDLWRPEHFRQLDALRATIAPMARKGDPPAYDIAHPALFDLGIKSVVVEDFSPVRPKGKGLWSATIKFLEYRPPKKKSVVSTPKSSKGIDDVAALRRHDDQGNLVQSVDDGAIASFEPPSASVPPP